MTGSQAVDIAVRIIAAAAPLCVAAVFLFLRRRFRGQTGAYALFGLDTLGWGLTVWGFILEPAMLSVRRVTVESSAWSGPPLRIGVISDTHATSPHVDVARVRKVVARMNALEPDLVVLLGDYAGSHEPAGARPEEERLGVIGGVDAFRGLNARLGVVGVLGNHDWWYDGPAIEAALRRARVVTLANSATRIPRASGEFYVAGLESLESRRSRPWPLMALRDAAASAPVIMLMHEPDAFAQTPPTVALSLAGHTHCGQVRFPFVGATVLPSPGSRRWPCGLYNEDGRQLYVTGGVGTSVLPVRFGASPEIAIVTLQAAAP